MNESSEVMLPRFIGSRDEARNLLDLAGAQSGQVVILNARNLRSASPSAVAELVTHALITRLAARIDVVSADDDFYAEVLDAAEAADVVERVHVDRHPLAI